MRRPTAVGTVGGMPGKGPSAIRLLVVDDHALARELVVDVHYVHPALGARLLAASAV